MARPIVIYIDVDETLLRNYGTARIPMPAVIRHVRQLFEEGAELYCWSSGGADYARRSAAEVGLEDCFRAFLPKPQVMLDDQPVADWRRLVYVHPNGCDGRSVEEYRVALNTRHLPS
ncbi:DUF705 domain-containing protein [Deinococcus puniceus]|uniref:Integrin n=1 Tax=Deinococcus puniceus TaxID=1182568 RepID=A0A172T7Z6_9DEIO|nr:DUF705 domain-containing protein [Deinococcus puniceus]ANE43121.1 integrin [Deinococcus puniceus]